MEQRKAKLSSIAIFIKDATEYIDNIVSDLGWDRNVLLCNKGPQQIRHKNDSNEYPFPESFFSEQHQCSVKIDEYTQARIIWSAHGENSAMELALMPDISPTREIPSSHEDLLVNFTRAERLALYQHAVESTPKHEPLPEFQISFKKRDNLAKLTPLAEIAAYRRDIRRRNQKYRVAKNPLTYQEEMRNLIQLQTEALTEYLGQPPPEEKNTDKVSKAQTAATSRRRESRTRSRSRERRIKKSRDRDDSGRLRDAKRKKHKIARSRSRSGHRHKSKKSKRDSSREKSRGRSKHKSRH